MLNCQVGDLAITVDAELTENIGNIAKVFLADGVGWCGGHSKST